MSASMTSLRLFAATNIPLSFHPIKPLISLTKRTDYVFFSRPIYFERISSKKVLQSSPSSSPSTANLQPIEELPPRLQEIIKLFQSVQDSKAKYEQLMFYGKKLKPLNSQYKSVENKVRGCVSQVWVRAFLDEDKKIMYEADSDSVLTKGLAALLVTGLSGSPVQEVLKVSPDFALHFGMQLSLTPNRNNGFLNMFRLMQKKALELLVQAEEDGNGMPSTLGSNYVEDLNSGSSNGGSGSRIVDGDGENLDSENGSGGSSSKSSSEAGLRGRGLRIKEKLEKELSPLELEVEDISYQHAGHAGVVGSDGETHFNVKIVSKEFEGKSLVKRHRLVYGLLQEELQSGLHALSIVAKTPAEVDAK